MQLHKIDKSKDKNFWSVACTRARDNLLVTGTSPASEFLDDLKQT